MRIMFALLLAPLLLAPVRLKDASPAFFTPPAQGPAPESYSLPSAEPLITPTVIQVSPTILPEVSITLPSSSTLNLPLSPSPTVQPVIIQQIVRPAPQLMPERVAALCQRGMLLVQDLSLLSYQQKPSKSLMTLSIAAATAAGEATGRQWPSLTAFNRAADNLPWFYPNKSEMTDAVHATRNLCGG